jgi:hypothetical protein
MAAAPLNPMSGPTAAPALTTEPLSQAARIVDTFIAPRKIFTDLRRSAAWWAPFLLMAVLSAGYVYIASQKVGFRKAMENQMQAQPKSQARLDQLPQAQREEQLDKGAKFTAIISYCFPAIQLLILLIIAAVMFATFKFAAGADISFKVAMTITVYASLPGLIKILLAVISLVAGMNPDSFTFQNPVGTNIGYYLNPADSPFFYSLASSLDIFLIWTLVLTAIGFTCVSKVKMKTALVIVFGWWIVFSLIGAGLASLG